MKLPQGDHWYHIKKQSEMKKKYIFKYIQDIRKNNKHVTTLIIFNKVAEIYPFFKAG